MGPVHLSNRVLVVYRISSSECPVAAREVSAGSVSVPPGRPAGTVAITSGRITVVFSVCRVLRRSLARHPFGVDAATRRRPARWSVRPVFGRGGDFRSRFRHVTSTGRGWRRGGGGVTPAPPRRRSGCRVEFNIYSPALWRLFFGEGCSRAVFRYGLCVLVYFAARRGKIAGSEKRPRGSWVFGFSCR